MPPSRPTPTRIGGAFLVAVLLAAGSDAAAQPAPGGPVWGLGELPLAERPTLFGGPGSPEAWLRERGVGLDISWTQYEQAIVSPASGDNGIQSTGKLNAKFNLDFARLGLWDGFSASGIVEYNTGNSRPNGFNGVLLPVNTQTYEPNNASSALSLTLTQRFGKDLSLTAGKFNMVDAASATPIVGGGGVNTFWNLNFAAPPSGVVPAYITGLSITFNTEPASYTLMIYDPRDSQNGSGLDRWGQDGINTRLAVRVPVKVRNLDGYHTIVAVWSTQDKVDLADLPWLILPPTTPNQTVDTKGDSWFLGWNFQQYLWQNPANPAVGWGIFGQAFIADGNPNQYRWFVNAGVAGNSPMAGRESDRFGIGFFNTSFSKDLTGSLYTITGYSIDDERGIELFYNAAVFPWLRIAADLQLIRPGVRDFGNAVFVGMSAQIKF